MGTLVGDAIGALSQFEVLVIVGCEPLGEGEFEKFEGGMLEIVVVHSERHEHRPLIQQINELFELEPRRRSIEQRAVNGIRRILEFGGDGWRVRFEMDRRMGSGNWGGMGRHITHLQYELGLV